MKRSQTYYNNRRRIRELRYDKIKFRPSVSDIEEWFIILNQQIFDDKLKIFTEIHIGKPKQVYALFYYWPSKNDSEKENRLHITQVFTSKRFFVEILGHEMIHLFQYQYNEPIGHGASFKVWYDNFNLKGLNLVAG